MIDQIKDIVSRSKTLDDLTLSMLELLIQIHGDDNKQIGYVSGLITSEGAENISKNFARLARYTEKIRAENSIQIFSPTDVFSTEVFSHFDAAGAVNRDYEIFWQKVLNSGNITNMYMTPRWEISHGATMEHQIALDKGMKIIYLTKEI